MASEGGVLRLLLCRSRRLWAGRLSRPSVICCGQWSAMTPALAGPALEAVTPDDFVSERAKALAVFMQERYQEGQPLDPKAVLAALGDDPRADTLAGLLMSSEEPLLPEALAGEIAHLKNRAKEQMLSELKGRIAGGTADTETLRQFARLQGELRGTPKSPAGREGK